MPLMRFLRLSGATLAAVVGAYAIALAATATYSIGTSTGPEGALQLFGLTSGSVTVKVPNVAGSNTITVPAVSDTLAVLGTSQSFTAGQAVTPDTATQCGTQSAAGTMTPNFALANSCVATFGAGNLTIANPTNVKAGQSWVLSLQQDGVGSRTVTWGTSYKWAGATAPTLSTTASAIDIISCWATDSTHINCALAVKGAS